MKFNLPFLSKAPRVAVIRLSGTIAAGTRGSLSDETLAPIIEKAFKRGKPAAVALLINSPGGSPVQSSLIAQRIRRLADEKEIPVHAFVEDVAASGGYWLASSADDIWADGASIIGSIGVISAGFGAHVFLERQGIERRVHTAGKSKSTLDPFQKEKPEDVKRLKAILSEMHDLFIAQVKERREDKLLLGEDLFTGEFWLAGRALELGLIDGIGHMETKLKELYGEKVKLMRYGRKKSLLSRFGAQVATGGLGALEERAEFARYGL
ncbi:S49 family peptidase [Rhodobacteraceae bacterium 63075]|nr:S49 family peptidase [Rhodobacteraceae bacterium 63075]